MAVPPRFYEYTVQPGDSMAGIVFKLYGWSPPSRRYGELRDMLVALNPHIRNPDRPMPWETMCLASDPRFYPGTDVPRPMQFASPDLSPPQRQAYWALSWLEHNSGLITNPGGAITGATQNLLSGGNVGLIEEVGALQVRRDHRGHVRRRSKATDRAVPAERGLAGALAAARAIGQFGLSAILSASVLLP